MHRLPLLVLALSALCAAAPAADLGMQAPPLKISKWVKGDPIQLPTTRGTNIYVVEFWATWCPPCRVSIPHLTAIQKRFKDQGVTIVGISNEPESKVSPFVTRQGDTMAYTVATDDADATTSRAYMEPFGVNGIPHAFIVDREGRIVWHGHPMSGLDTALEEIVSGRFDLESARRAAAAAATLPQYFEKAVAAEEPTSARTLGEQILKDGAKDASLLNSFAWIILTHPRIQKRDLDLAMRIAKAADTLTNGKDPSVTDTLARAHFVSGNITEAIATQKRALTLTDDAGAKTKLTQTLDEYQAAATPK